MIVAHNYTRHFALEGRQHNLLGVDLGEGPHRKTLIFGMVIIPTWCLLLFGVLSLMVDQPINKYTSALFMIPPAVIVMFGMRPSSRTRRRRALTQWIMMVRYPLLGHQPIIRLGARRSHRRELVPLATRWQGLFDNQLFRIVLPSAQRPVWDRDDANDENSQTNPQAENSAPIRMTQHVVVLGGEALFDQLTQQHQRHKQQKRDRHGSV